MIIDLSKFKKHYVVIYDGKTISDNLFYSAKHWAVRAGMKNDILKYFTIKFLQAKIKPMSEIALVVKYNNRTDCDNNSIIGKMMVDSLKHCGYIVNDDKRFYRTRVTIFDETLPKQTVEFHILGND